MKNTFNYMFKDNEFSKKALIYFGIAFLMNITMLFADVFFPISQNKSIQYQYIVLILISSLLSFITSGYWLSCIRSIKSQEDNIILPFIDFKKDFISGLKIVLAIIFITIPVCVLLLFLLIICKLLSHINLTILANFLFILSFVGIPILLIIYSNSMSAIFAQKEWLSSFFRFKRATIAIKNSGKTYFIGIAILLLAGIIFGIITALFGKIINNSFIGIILNSVIASVIGTYFLYLSSYVIAKSVKLDD